MRTRRSADEKEEEAMHVPGTAPAVEDSSSDDDDAPEEVTLAATKTSAAERREKEQAAIKHAKETVKQQRRAKQEAASASKAEAAAAAAAAKGADGEAEAGAGAEAEAELDLLPDDVIEAMADPNRDRRELERRLVSEQLKNFRREGGGKSRKARPEAGPRRVGPVTVEVLKRVGVKRTSDAAKSFLQQRLYGESVKRSSEMLKPTKIGGYFVHPSSTTR